jgi:UDP-N-acetylglucosamine acyltransferase
MNHPQYPYCVIDPAAKIAPNVQIDPFVTIQGDVEIGEGTWIGSNVVIYNGARIGKNCKIFPGAVIAAIPQDMKFRGEYSTAEVGNNVTIREFVTINRGTSYSYKTIVEDNVLLMAYCHIAHDCVVKKYAILANSVHLAGHVLVDEHAVLGGSGGVHQFVRIGKHAMVAAGVVVRQDVPPYVTTARNPLCYNGINHRGLSRRNFDPETQAEIKEIYRVVFLSKLNRKQAIEKIEQDFQPSAVQHEILTFLKEAGQRGLIKAYDFAVGKKENDNTDYDEEFDD